MMNATNFVAAMPRLADRAAITARGLSPCDCRVLALDQAEAGSRASLTSSTGMSSRTG